jgi:hypothetical protein
LKTYWILLAILLVLAFGSCSPIAPSKNSPALTPLSGQSQESATQIPSDNSSGNPISPINTLDSSEITPLPAEANPFVKLVEEDLADRLSINVDQIHFLKISDIDWQDITKGCASTPGQKLTKGRLSGYQIWLEANGKNYAYHIGLDNTIFLCPD